MCIACTIVPSCDEKCSSDSGGIGGKDLFQYARSNGKSGLPKNQMVGVFNLELARMYGYLYQNTDKNFTVLHALDGYDEISLTGATKTISRGAETMLSPQDFGVSSIEASAIVGGDDIADSAQIFTDILNGKGTEAQNNVVCANAGVAIATVEGIPVKEGFEKAKESLLGGKGLEKLKKLQELSKN